MLFNINNNKFLNEFNKLHTRYKASKFLNEFN